MSRDNSSYDGFSTGGSNTNSVSQYGGGGGGGGFPSASASSAAAAASGSTKRDPDALLSVNCKLVNEAREKHGGRIVIGDPEMLASNVKCIANVLAIKRAETHVEIDVEDGSGTIVVRKYLDQGEEPPRDMHEGQYCRVIGKIRKIGGTMCITAFTVDPVTDMNAFTAHSLEIILQQRKAEKSAAQGNTSDVGQAIPPPSSSAAAAASSAASSGQRPQAQRKIPSTGNTIHDQILAAFANSRDAGTDNGCSVANVMQRLPRLTPAAVRASIEQLCNAGHLYSTIDEEHYKTTVDG